MPMKAAIKAQVTTAGKTLVFGSVDAAMLWDVVGPLIVIGGN